MNTQYICLDCGHLFDIPERYMERHGLDTPPFEEYHGCPCCGGAYTWVMICDGCGMPITGDYIKIKQTHERYCDQCFVLKEIGT